VKAAHGRGREPALRVGDLHVDLVVVLRDVEERGAAQDEAGGLVPPAAVDAGPMRAKRADLIAHAQVGLVALVADEVDGPAQRVGAESHGHDAAIHLDAIDQVHGHVGDAEGKAREVERHAVEEEANLVVVQAVEREASLAAEPAAAPDGDALRARQHLAEIRRLLLRLACVDDVDRLRRLLQTLGLAAADLHHHLGEVAFGERRLDIVAEQRLHFFQRGLGRGGFGARGAGCSVWRCGRSSGARCRRSCNRRRRNGRNRGRRRRSCRSWRGRHRLSRGGRLGLWRRRSAGILRV
jgi:hypothetical protein